ncbi:U6 snRNA phosphodiesterase 1-like isoform X2 [Babylonia areolata]|uniref:U6 snRNA phosphodiesterase 1-like isoform X2 n=1 Tax=Babylonia areolata TaxID=304850 RepID=UPI003FD15FED
MNSLVSYSGSSSEDEGERSKSKSMKRYAQNRLNRTHDTEAPVLKRCRADNASKEHCHGACWGCGCKWAKKNVSYYSFKGKSWITSSLPLPTAILGMFGDRQRDKEDDPKQHGGRVRSFPHVEGNWASFVYIPVSADERLNSFADKLLTVLQPLNFERMDDLHISLSRTVCIRHHWISPLTESLKEKFQQLHSCYCDVGSVEMYTNDEKSRTFISMEVNPEENNLMEYISVVDTCFREFDLPSFYENPSFHISLIWCVGDVISQITKKMAEKLQVDSAEAQILALPYPRETSVGECHPWLSDIVKEASQ